MDATQAPFSCTYTPAVAELLDGFRASGKLSVEEERWTEAP